MKVDIAGKVKNTNLPKTKALLAVFEAVVNSFQAIEDAGLKCNGKIEIVVEREGEMLPELVGTGKITAFTITDNGVGFTDTNTDAFFTSDTLYKAVRGGKSLGRFI